MMNKEDKKIQENLVNEMMKVSKTNPDVMIYMQSLMKCYEELELENEKLQEEKDHYKHLYSAVKKQKDDVVVFAKKEKENYLTKACRIADTNNAGLITSAAIYTCDEILRMLGEIDEYQEKEKNI